ncbi:DUF6779 domain-containing protein [Corynebacterium freneyi]|uniref:DUF6779 domain-containing protein n=1 Tax=Corynebacterium freneyi TaxID=134034 RepID=A0ABS4U4M8_9CORY|nr:DUF6779 domain-containing protein [Corynebacterium freneyi]MBP2331612.1 hypothetical protein [Corynebacterium freneyi]MCG7439497.1 hypothetical protein [Corynebacterium freneyi]QXA51929.1 hypothetical protein I6L56_07245 [Corynebacterium freneyi]WJZ06265.1 hypothetical protein CFREN_11655 [Corynebacterium freneyi]
MTQPEDFDVDRNGQHSDVADSGRVEEWGDNSDGTASADRPVAAGDGDTTDKVATGMMVALIALAVIASVVMLFTDSTGWMKIAVLAGLWAAVIGALLVTRYRRQLAAERERIADLEVMHSLELDRELATHREQELILEQNYLDSLDAKSDDTIAQLRAEIVALREHLAELLGADLDEERIALRARAERLRELDAPSSSPLKDPESHQRPKPRATAHRAEATANGSVGSHTNHGPHGPSVPGVPEEWDEKEAFESREEDGREPVDVPVVDNGVPGHTFGGGFNTGSFKAVPWQTESEEKAETKSQFRPAPGAHGAHEAPETPDAPDAAESRPTAVLPRVEDEQADSDAATADAPKITEPGTYAAHAARDDRAAWGTHAEQAEQAEPAPQPESAPQGEQSDAPADAAPSGRRGRRRAEDHEGGLTVAELLAQMRERREAGE